MRTIDRDKFHRWVADEIGEDSDAISEVVAATYGIYVCLEDENGQPERAVFVTFTDCVEEYLGQTPMPESD